MKIKILVAAFTLILTVTNKSAFAQESILRDISEDYVGKLIQVAKTNYPRYKVFKAQVDGAKADVGIASVSILDALTLSYVYQGNSVSAVDPANPQSRLLRGLQVGVFFNLGLLVRMPLNIKKAKAAQRVAEFNKAEYDLTLATEVKKRYYTYLQNLAQLKIQTRASQQTESGFKDMEYKYKKGEETFNTYNSAQITQTQQAQSRIAAEAQVFVAKAELEELLGDKLETIK